MTEPSDGPKTDPVGPGDEPTSVPVRWVNTPWPVPEQDDIVKLLEFYGESDLNVDPADLIPKLTTADNQALTAAGVFGTASESNVEGADFSRYSGVSTDSLEGGGFRTRAYSNGKKIADETSTFPPDTVEFWNKAVAAAEE